MQKQESKSNTFQIPVRMDAEIWPWVSKMYTLLSAFCLELESFLLASVLESQRGNIEHFHSTDDDTEQDFLCSFSGKWQMMAVPLKKIVAAASSLLT